MTDGPGYRWPGNEWPPNEWQVEEGIGEHRAALVAHGRIIAARIEWPGALAAGLVGDAALISRASGSARGTARFPNGEEALVDRLPRDASEGAAIRLAVTRPALAERGRRKLARTVPTDAAPCPAPTLFEQLEIEGFPPRRVRRIEGDWDDLWQEAWDGEVAFSGGSLVFAATPAMVLVDVDGVLLPRELALAAVTPLAEALRRFDLAGSIGIDFPTLPAKDDRRAVDRALAEALADWPHERTAINGFGLVQIVARMERASLLHRIGGQRMSAAARRLLRQAESVEAPGALLLRAHPGVVAALRDEWRTELARRTGRQLRIEADPALAPGAGFAQAVA